MGASKHSTGDLVGEKQVKGVYGQEAAVHIGFRVKGLGFRQEVSTCSSDHMWDFQKNYGDWS